MTQDAPELGVRGARVDAGPAQSLGVDPHRVVVAGLEGHGPVSHRLVEHGCVAHAVRQQPRVVAPALDPVELGMFSGIGAHALDQVVHRRRADERHLAELDAAPQRMGVAIAEARHEAPAGEVELGGAASAVVERVVVERHDDPVVDGDRSRDRVPRVPSEDRSVAKQQRSAHAASNLRSGPFLGQGIPR